VILKLVKSYQTRRKAWNPITPYNPYSPYNTTDPSHPPGCLSFSSLPQKLRSFRSLHRFIDKNPSCSAIHSLLQTNTNTTSTTATMRASVLLLAAATVAVASAESVELFGAGDEGGEHYEFLASSLGSVSRILFLTLEPSNQRQ
jgi:hypothetical protein